MIANYKKKTLIDESLNLQFEVVGMNLDICNLKEKGFKLADNAFNHSKDHTKS